MKLDGIAVHIRTWGLADREAMIPMILDCLETNFQAGADMLPTYKNADVLWRVGVLASAKGEPTLVATIDDKPVGYTLWCDLPNPLDMDLKHRILYGLGTYIAEPYRRIGLSEHLRNVAEGMAARSGFTKISGTAYHEAGLQSVLKRGFAPAGILVEKTL